MENTNNNSNNNNNGNNSNGFELEHVIAGYEKSITSCCWNPHNSQQVGCTSQDQTFTIWDIVSEEAVVSLKLEASPLVAQWCPTAPDILAIVTDDGYVRILSSKATISLVVRDLDFSPISVLRWSPKLTATLATGHEDCSVVFYNYSTKKSKRVKSNKDRAGGVADMQWDVLSDTYLLVAFNNGDMVLLNADTAEEIRSFERQAGGVQSLSWIPSMPGSFLAASGRHGVVRQWSVAQSSPETSFKVGNGGVENIVDIGGKRFLCCMADGSVGVYNMALRRWDHQSSVCHSETVFSCEFKPSDPNILATASFDESVRLWDIRGYKPLGTIRLDSGAVYAVSWCADPASNLLVAATAKGKVFLCDTEKMNIVATLSHHHQQSIRVAWNQKDANLIASTSSDCSCVIFNRKGEAVTTLKHPGPVFGCDWSPFTPSLLATGCGDSMVRVFDTQKLDVPPIGLAGHTAKVFNVQFSPHSADLIASGSDDFTVRVWSMSTKTCLATLAGHTSFVRGLQWHYEIPYLLLSGSWDGCIRLWDTRGSGSCVRTVMDHHADVYGLATHRDRPFFFASCSRDTTIRFWMTDEYCAAAKLLASSGMEWASHVCGAVEEVLIPSYPAKLTGTKSAQLAKEMAAAADNLTKARLVGSMFFNPDGSAEMLDIMGVMTKGLPSDFANRIVFCDSTVSALLSKAQELEQARSSHFAGIGRPTKKDSLLAAAEIYARLGYMKNYCDILVELGEWTNALICAPAVSMEYWQSLVAKRAELLAAEGDTEAVPLMVASHNPQKAISFFLQRSELENAFSVAQCREEGGYKKIAAAVAASPASAAAAGAVVSSSSKSEKNETSATYRRSVVQAMSLKYARNGNPTLAACCYLAVSDVDGAIRTLVNAVDVDSALIVLQGLGSLATSAAAAAVYRLGALRAERMLMWNLALQLLLQGGAECAGDVEGLASRFKGDEAAIAQFYVTAKLPSPAEYLVQAVAAAAKDSIEAAKLYVLGRDYQKAADIGLKQLRVMFTSNAWNIESVEAILSWLTFIPLDHILPVHGHEILGYAFGVGAFRASWKGWFSIVGGLVANAVAQAKGAEVFALNIAVLELLAADSCCSIGESLSESLTTKLRDMTGDYSSPALSILASSLQRSRVSVPSPQLSYPTGNPIPSAATRRAKVVHDLTGKQIQGPEFWLLSRADERPRAISLADAAMWARVCRFQPSSSGAVLIPF